MTAKHFLAAFLGALAIFLSSFIFHMFTPLGEAGIGPLPGVDAVSSSLTVGDRRQARHVHVSNRRLNA